MILLKKSVSIVVLSIAIALSIAFLLIAFDQIADTTAAASSPTNTDYTDSFVEMKTIRDATISCCVFAIGLFAIVFEIGKKDKYGHSLKQENHFELCYIYKKVAAPKWGFVRRSIPVRFLIPYPVYLLLIIASAVLCALGQSCSWAIYVICSLFVLSFLFTVCYTLYVLYVMYGQDWIVNKTLQICEKAVSSITIEPAENNKLKLASHSLRILAGSGSSCPNDFINIHKTAMRNLWEYLSNKFFAEHSQKDKEFLFNVIRYYESLLTSIFISAADTGDLSQPIIENLVASAFAQIGCSVTEAKNHPLFLVAGIASCKTLTDSIRRGKLSRKLFSNIDEKSIGHCINALYEKLDILYQDNPMQENTIARELYRLYVQNTSSCLNNADIAKHNKLISFAKKYFRRYSQKEDAADTDTNSGVSNG